MQRLQMTSIHDPDAPSAAPTSMFGAPHKSPHKAMISEKQYEEQLPQPLPSPPQTVYAVPLPPPPGLPPPDVSALQRTDPSDSAPLPLPTHPLSKEETYNNGPSRVWLSGPRGNIPINTPVPSSYVGMGQDSVVERQPARDQAHDRQWVVLGGSQPPQLPSASTRREMPAAPIKVQDLADEINRMREREAGMTVQLSRAEANLQRKMEMIEILKGQLDEADKKSSMAMTVAERMKMQEQLLQAQTQADQLKKEIETERAQNSANIQELEAKLEEETLNSKEMLAELRQIRAEKDSEAAVAASTIKALTDERNMLRMELAALQSEGNMLRNELSTVQFQQQELQQMRQDYANLDEVVQSSKIDNLALSAQIKFLSTQLQEAKNAEIAGEAFKKTMVPAVPLTDHNDEQARFYEQEILKRALSPQPQLKPMAMEQPTAWAQPLSPQQAQPPAAWAQASQLFSPHAQEQQLFSPGGIPRPRLKSSVAPSQALGTPNHNMMPLMPQTPLHVQSMPPQAPQQQQPLWSQSPQQHMQAPQFQPWLPQVQQHPPQAQQHPTPVQHVAMNEMTREQVAQAGFDPNSVIGV